MVQLAPMPTRPRSERPQDVFVWRLEQLLAERGSAKVVAQRSGISEETISKWRRRTSPINPSLRVLERLARALGMRACDLITPPP